MAGTDDENVQGPPSVMAPPPNGTVDGTNLADNIDDQYTGDPEGDQVDDGVAYSSEIDDWVVAGDGDDNISAGYGDDVVDAGEGKDVVSGGEGSDIITLGDGDDYGSGGSGDDTIRGGSGLDILAGGEGEDLLLGGDDKDIIYGGDDNDHIGGGAGNDQLYGEEGDDCMSGGEGKDEMIGGAGHDLMFGGGGNDTLIGGGGNDTMVGGDGDDLLLGNTGDDTFYGGAGDDFMKGFEGSDSFHIAVEEGGPSHDKVNGGANQTGEYHPENGTNGSGIDKLYVEGPVSVTLFDDHGNFVRTIEMEVGDEEDLQAQGLDDGIVTLSDGSTVTFSAIEQICVVEHVPEPEECICFTRGSQIATIGGLVPVDQLKVGDKVITRDNGYQEIRWIGRNQLSPSALARQPHLKPVMIRKGSLGADLPGRDMMVSPQHRMLLTNAELMLHFGESEVLVPAKHLVNDQNIGRVTTQGVEYIHVLFDHHEVILADGAWTESFQPGDYSLGTLDQDARSELRALFPELENPEGQVAYTASRPTLKAREVEMRNALSA